MSLATAGAKWLGSLFGDAMKPKVAGAAAAGGSLLYPTDDAEAAPVRGVVKSLDELVNLFNKRTSAGEGKKNALSVPQSLIHDPKFSTYDAMNTYAKGKDVDGTTAGPYWKEEVQSIYDQIVEHGGLSNESRRQLDEWRKAHVGRPLGFVEEATTKRAPKPQADPNLAFGDLKTMMAAAGAAGAAGSTKAGEMTSPEIRGFQPWSDFEPEPSYWDRVTDPSTYANALMPYFEAGSWLANTPVGKYVGGQVGEAMDSAEIPGRFIQGAGRAGYGVLNGESLPEAFNAGRDTYGNTLAENGEALEQWGIDRGWHEDDASAASTFATYGLDPLTYAGFGLLGKIGGALK